MKDWTTFDRLLVLALVVLLLGPKLPGCPSVGPTKATLIVMLHEEDHGPLPSYALGAANELAAAGKEVRPVDDDLVTGLDEVPTWLKPALEPGRAIMGSDQKGDALVLLAGDKVLKAIKLPATKEAILEAAQ